MGLDRHRLLLLALPFEFRRLLIKHEVQLWSVVDHMNLTGITEGDYFRLVAMAIGATMAMPLADGEQTPTAHARSEREDRGAADVRQVRNGSDGGAGMTDTLDPVNITAKAGTLSCSLAPGQCATLTVNSVVANTAPRALATPGVGVTMYSRPPSRKRTRPSE